MKRFCLALVVFVSLTGSSFAQNTSQVFGRVTDPSGGVLPGVTVTLLSPALLEPRAAVTSETGTYQFPGLPIGIYAVRFELGGFGARIREGLQLAAGFNAQVNVELQIAGLQEGVVVQGTSPIVDVRSASQGAEFNLEVLNTIPSSRDLFHVMNQTPGIAGDRPNVGVTANGQQTGMFSRGAGNGQSRYFVDGVDQTSILEGRPLALDFNAVEELQIVTGGADITQQTPGVVINIITKSGGDSFRGSGWTFLTDRAFGSDNLSDAPRREGASSGPPLVNVKDYGGQLGGPIKKGRAWFFGTTGQQKGNFGILNFYKKTPDCAPVAANPLQYPFGEVVDCMNLNKQTVPSYGFKTGVRPFKNNQLSVGGSFVTRLETVRGSSELNPFDTTQRFWYVRKEDASSQAGIGPPVWNHSVPAPSWRFGDQHTVNDRWLLDFTFGHHCNCTVITPQTEELRAIQPMLELTTGNRQRSYDEVHIFWRTNNSTELATTYFLPGWLGGDHSIKAGYRYGRYRRMEERTWSGDAIAVFNSVAPLPLFATPFTARINRNGTTIAFLYQHSLYFQDTYSYKRFTLNLGFRWDRQEDAVSPMSVPAHAWQGLPTLDGTPFRLLPAIDAPGARAGVIWNSAAPRLGVSYDLTGEAKNVLKASYGIYFDQSSEGQLSRVLNPTPSNTSVDFGWTDLNGDQVVQPGEVNQGLIRSVVGLDPANPAAGVATNQVDPKVTTPRTDEIIFGFAKEMEGNIGFNVSYIWRRYTNFIWQDTIGLTSADYSPVTFTPAATACPSSSRCQAVTYFVPNIRVPSGYVLTNRPDFSRSYDGLELVVRKRSSDGWMLNGSLSYNNSVEHYDSPQAYEDPTNIAQRNNTQFAPGGSEIGGGGASILSGVPVNAKWIGRLNGSYRLPWDVTLAATADLRQGYPFTQAINIASRPNLAPAVAVLLDPLGEVRYPTFKTLDFRVEKTFNLGRVRVQPSFDFFNVFNASTVMGQRTNQNAANANQVFAILGPRTGRIGVMVTF